MATPRTLIPSWPPQSTPRHILSFFHPTHLQGRVLTQVEVLCKAGEVLPHSRWRGHVQVRADALEPHTNCSGRAGQGHVYMFRTTAVGQQRPGCSSADRRHGSRMRGRFHSCEPASPHQTLCARCTSAGQRSPPSPWRRCSTRFIWRCGWGAGKQPSSGWRERLQAGPPAALARPPRQSMPCTMHAALHPAAGASWYNDQRRPVDLT